MYCIPDQNILYKSFNTLNSNNLFKYILNLNDDNIIEISVNYIYFATTETNHAAF